jgi:integrase
VATLLGKGTVYDSNLKWNIISFTVQEQINQIGNICSRKLIRHFKQATKEAGLPDIRFHDLHHTAATILLQQDVHPKKVQELLGHSTIVLTLDTYSHIIPSMHSETADKMGSVFG